jgi:ubiquinone/menaquinone biosynthesis C-methylase UbiE
MRLTMREARWRPLIVEAVAEAKPKVILDLGCGTGSLTIPIAQKTGARVIGIDGDPVVLARAAAKPGSDRVEWTEAMVDALPLAPGEADFVVSSLVFHHLPLETKRAALAEAHRILKPGGNLIVADWAAPQDPLMSSAFFLLQCLDGFATTSDNRRGMIPGLIAEAGFTAPQRLHIIRTVFGSFEVLSAQRPT